jgi:hypothetical protein
MAFDPRSFGASSQDEFDPYQLGAQPDQNINEDAVNNLLSQIPSASQQSTFLQSNPELQSALRVIGDVGMFYNPQIMESPGILPALVNSAARIGAGTAATTAYQLGSPTNTQSLTDAINSNLKSNAMVEGGMSLTRIPGGMAELFNPVKYSNQLADNIANTYTDLKNQEKQMYQPVFNKYGSDQIQPNLYKDSIQDNKVYFSPDVKILNNKFLDEPTLQNAQDLQSQIFKRMELLQSNPIAASLNSDKIEGLNQAREALKNDMYNHLQSTDENAANQYLDASYFHKSQVAPFMSNVPLAEIATGTAKKIDPKFLSKALNDVSFSNDVLEKNPELIQNHVLTQSADSLNNAISKGQTAQQFLPALGAILGTVGGETIHPGVGALLGAGAGSQIGTAFKPLVGAAQQPFVQNIAKYLSPASYAAGRYLINQNNS